MSHFAGDGWFQRVASAATMVDMIHLAAGTRALERIWTVALSTEVGYVLLLL